MRARRHVIRISTVLALLLTVPSALVAGGTAASAAETYSQPFQTAVSQLPVRTESRTGYTRDQFKLWVDADGDGCDTRKEVLISEADDPVTVGSSCSLSGGRWFSYYDRVSWTDSGRIDIDHVVPLAEAWDSGARSWTATQRQSYANDLGDYRTLVGVTDSVNQSKGDQDPATWQPSLSSFRCTYARAWVQVKWYYHLTVDSAEKSALNSMLATC